MNKKVFVIFVALMAVALLATPLVGLVTADPTQGQKEAITITWTAAGQTTIEQRDPSGIVSLRHIHANFKIVIVGDDGTVLSGTAISDRDATIVLQKDGKNRVLREYYVISFPNGGFEGNALILLDYYGTGASDYTAKTHGLFIGTGAFEGQTINAGKDWGPAGLVWEGYLLKP